MKSKIQNQKQNSFELFSLEFRAFSSFELRASNF